MKKKILITGGKGVLAGYVRKSLNGESVFAPNHQALDVTDKKAVESFFKKIKPDIVIHLAAKTNVDECEKKPKEAFLVNSEGTKNIAVACRKYKAFLVYVSTAAVFDGRKNCFYEGNRKNPVNIYGKSKLLGEEYIHFLPLKLSPWLKQSCLYQLKDDSYKFFYLLKEDGILLSL